MSAMTAAQLRALRAAIVAPGRTPAEQRTAAWAYHEAIQKAPALVLLWSHLTDWTTTRAQRRRIRRLLDEIHAWRDR